jgi:Xaa-Pro aminopeptidase
MITHRSDRPDALALPASLQAILDAEHPRFSDAEMARRRAAIEALLKDEGCDHLVFCGANRFGSSVQWLTGWPVTTEAVGVLTPGEADAMFVQHVNHAPLAQKMAARAKVVWGGGSSIGAAIEVLERRAAQSGRVAVIGPMTFEQHATLAARFGAVKNLNRSYTRLRQVKSAEEIDWMRIGAALSDRGMIALRDGMRPGLSEREFGDLVERAYVPLGGTTVIHFIGVTAMADPQLGVPTQFASSRRAATGDVVFAEISAAFWDHPGQVLRSFALGAEPIALYRDLHAAADAAFAAVAAVLKDGAMPRQVIEAASVIEDSGFTSRPSAHVPDEPFRAGMVVVIQPNVVTRDGKAGVQTGEMVLITKTGIEPFHAVPRGFVRAGE